MGYFKTSLNFKTEINLLIFYCWLIWNSLGIHKTVHLELILSITERFTEMIILIIIEKINEIDRTKTQIKKFI
jgi:hypothetical protein